MVLFTKDKARQIAQGKWRIKKQGVDEVLAHYEYLKKQTPNDHTTIASKMKEWYSALPKDDIKRAHKHYQWSDSRGLYFAADFAGPDDGRESRPRYDIIHPVTRMPCKKPSTGWRWDEERTVRALAEDPPRIHFGPNETTIPCRKSYLFEIDSEPFASVFYRDGRAGTLELEKFVGAGLFDFPKDVETIKTFIGLCDDPDGIYLDFFAGSGTTAQAVWERNVEDKQNRKFILVQLPEVVEKQGYETIADISKERIRRVSKKLKAEAKAGAKTAQQTALPLDADGATPPATDLGFKVFKVDDSHFPRWADYEGEDAGALQMRLDQASNQPLSAGWQADAVLTEIALQEGFPLDSRIAVAPEFKRNTVHVIAHEWCAHRLFVCLDARLYAETIRDLRLLPQDVFICFDAALTDETKLRLTDACKVKVI